MEPKSIKNRFKIRSKFQSDFGVVLGPFLINFERILETLNPQKWCSRVGAVLFLRKSRFSDQIRFWIDFFMIFDAFGDHFGEAFGIKIASKTRSKKHTDFGSIFDRFWFPICLDFGQFWLQKSIKNQTRNLKEKEPRMNRCTSMDGKSSWYQKWLRGGALKSTRHKTRTDRV